MELRHQRNCRTLVSAAERDLFANSLVLFTLHTSNLHPCTQAVKITVAQGEEEVRTAGVALHDRPMLLWSPFWARSQKFGLPDDQCAVWQSPDLGGGLQAPRLRFSWGAGLPVPQVAADCTPHRLQHRLTARDSASTWYFWHISASRARRCQQSQTVGRVAKLVPTA